MPSFYISPTFVLVNKDIVLVSVNYAANGASFDIEEDKNTKTIIVKPEVKISNIQFDLQSNSIPTKKKGK